MKCPTCRIDLTQQQNEFGYFYNCERCKGEFHTIGNLRKHNKANEILKEIVTKTQNKQGRKCPKCAKNMNLIYPSDSRINYSLEYCSHDRIIWFDADKFDKFPENPQKFQKTPIEKTEQVLKLLKIEQNAELHKLDRYSNFGSNARSYLVSLIPGAFIGILIVLLITSKLKIFTLSTVLPLTFLSAFICGTFSFFIYRIIHRMKG